MPYSGRLRTGDPSLLRQLNLSVVMHYLRERAPVYRAQLAELTGLNKTTVSSLVSELMEHQFVQEVGARTNGATGRPAMMLELNPAAGCAVAADIGVDFLSVGVANFTAEDIWRQTERFRMPVGQQAMMDRLLALLQSAVQRGLAESSRVLGIALGVPGLVDRETGTLLFAPNLGWADVPFRRILAEQFNVPIFVDNEANLAAIGEASYGAAHGFQDVLYISAGVGLGGGIVRDGRLYRGASGFAGEFGHMTTAREGEQCSCGNYGCWETEVSERALRAHIARALEQGRPSLVGTGMPARELSITEIVDAARAGDAVAIEAFTAIAHPLGAGIASLVNTLNPELVVLGGTLSAAGEFLLPVIERELERRALRWNSAAARLVLAQHRFGACVMGGIATVFQSIPNGVLSQGGAFRAEATSAAMAAPVSMAGSPVTSLRSNLNERG